MRGSCPDLRKVVALFPFRHKPLKEVGEREPFGAQVSAPGDVTKTSISSKSATVEQVRHFPTVSACALGWWDLGPTLKLRQTNRGRFACWSGKGCTVEQDVSGEQ